MNLILLLLQLFGPSMAEILTSCLRLVVVSIQGRLEDKDVKVARYEAEVLYSVAYEIVSDAEKTDLVGSDKRELALSRLRLYRDGNKNLLNVKDARLNTIIEMAQDRLEEKQLPPTSEPLPF